MHMVRLAIVVCALAFFSSSDAQVRGAPARHAVMSGAHPLAVWSRSPANPKRTILLIHGRTWSALPNFDLQVTARNRSVLQSFAKLGYAAYALDLRGYGSTPRNAGDWNFPNQAADDIAATLQWIHARHSRLEKPTLIGWSMGSLLSQLTAQEHPELIAALVLYGYPRDPAITATAPSPSTPLRELNTRERAASDFISPQVTTDELIATYVRVALATDPIRADWHQLEQYSALDPKRVITPTLLIHGERDPLAPIAAQSRLFVALGTADKQWRVLPGGDHAAMIESTHDAFIAAIHSFITRPTNSEGR